MNSASDEVVKQALEQQAKIDKLKALPVDHTKEAVEKLQGAPLPVDHTKEAIEKILEVEKLKSGFSPLPEPKQLEPSDFDIPGSPKK